MNSTAIENENLRSSTPDEDRFADYLQYLAGRIAGSRLPLEETVTDKNGQSSADFPEKSRLLPKLQRKVQKRGFQTERRFIGTITNIDGDVLEADVKAEDGATFVYSFSLDNLPERQREKASKGSFVSVYFGHQFVGRTKSNLFRVYLNLPLSAKQAREQRVAAVAAKWTF